MEVFIYEVDGHSCAVEVTKEESLILEFFKNRKELISSLAFVMNIRPRVVWEYIADIRLKGIPLVGDQNGVWLSTCSKEIDGYTKHQAKRAKKTIQSEFAIINSLRATARVDQPPMFDEPRGFFTRLFS